MIRKNLNVRERKVLAKFLQRVASDPAMPPLVLESVENLLFWFGRYLDMNAVEIIEKMLEGYERQRVKPIKRRGALKLVS